MATQRKQLMTDNTTGRQKHILVIDDEPDICEILRFNLQAAGYDVDTAHSAEEAVERGLSAYDLLLLDVMMPGMSGLELARMADVPFIFLTAKSSEEDVLQGFGTGADDYITKPFSVREVLARVKVVLSRNGREPLRHNTARLLRHKGITLSLDLKTVDIDGQAAALTKTEFELLRLLIGRRGQVLSRQELMRLVWPDFVVTARTVDVNIARLRHKLGPYSGCIVSRQGYGYILEP